MPVQSGWSAGQYCRTVVKRLLRPPWRARKGLSAGFAGSWSAGGTGRPPVRPMPYRAPRRPTVIPGGVRGIGRGIAEFGRDLGGSASEAGIVAASTSRLPSVPISASAPRSAASPSCPLISVIHRYMGPAGMPGARCALPFAAFRPRRRQRTQGSKAEITRTAVGDAAQAVSRAKAFARRSRCARSRPVRSACRSALYAPIRPTKQALLAICCGHGDLFGRPGGTIPPAQRWRGGTFLALSHPDQPLNARGGVSVLYGTAQPDAENRRVIAGICAAAEDALEAILIAGEAQGTMSRSRQPPDHHGADRHADRRHQLVSRGGRLDQDPGRRHLLGSGAGRSARDADCPLHQPPRPDKDHMSLPPQFLDEIRARVPLIARDRAQRWCGICAARIRPRATGGRLPVSRRKTASFHVDDQKGFYYCFGCHARATR